MVVDRWYKQILSVGMLGLLWCSWEYKLGKNLKCSLMASEVGVQVVVEGKTTHIGGKG